MVTLPNCHYQIVITKLTLLNCYYQIVITKMKLPNCHHQIDITKNPPVTVTVVNPTLSSMYGGALENTLTVPLN